ncbi:MAG: XRE family transcriptional regulator [Magnetococcus sp. DMHC-6]
MNLVTHEHLGDRIQNARKLAGLTQKELADMVGISQTAVHKLECGRSKSSRKTVTIALTCGVDPVWLETGRGDMTITTQNATSPQTHISRQHVAENERKYSTSRSSLNNQAQSESSESAKIPLLSWSEAGERLTNPQANIDYVHLGPQVNDSTFALKVSGDAMETEFSNGDIILVDPSLQPCNNAFVVVRLLGEDNATFKQLIMDGGRRYLKPLNPRYPIIEIDYREPILSNNRRSLFLLKKVTVD